MRTILDSLSKLPASLDQLASLDRLLKTAVAAVGRLCSQSRRLSSCRLKGQEEAPFHGEIGEEAGLNQSACSLQRGEEEAEENEKEKNSTTEERNEVSVSPPGDEEVGGIQLSTFQFGLTELRDAVGRFFQWTALMLQQLKEVHKCVGENAEALSQAVAAEAFLDLLVRLSDCRRLFPLSSLWQCWFLGFIGLELAFPGAFWIGA